MLRDEDKERDESIEKQGKYNPWTKIWSRSMLLSITFFLYIPPSLKISDLKTEASRTYVKENEYLETYGCQFRARENPGSVNTPLLIFYMQRTLNSLKICLERNAIHTTLVLENGRALRFYNWDQVNWDEVCDWCSSTEQVISVLEQESLTCPF